MLLSNINLDKLDKPIEELGNIARQVMRKRLARTCSFIKALHNGQQDKQGMPYWHHAFRVMKRLESVPGISECVLHAALLHDVIEDTETSIDNLWQLGYPHKTLCIVDEVTRYERRIDRGQTYMQWIMWISAFGRQGSRLVKAADIADHLAPGRLANLPREMQGIDRRYQGALEALYTRLPQELFAAIKFGDFIGPHWIEPRPDDIELMIEEVEENEVTDD